MKNEKKSEKLNSFCTLHAEIKITVV